MRLEELRKLMRGMTLKEKIGQLVQLDGGCFGAGELATGPQARLGVTQEDVDVCGSVLNVLGAQKVRDVQRRYLERSRTKIPLLFMADVIYGYQTCFPIPLALGCTWDPERIGRNYRLVAEEAQADGCMVTFSPAVDLVRDARWGRVLEMPGGEDPYLGSCFADAMVRGFQDGLEEGRGVASCVKHFAGYGAAEGGREYNTVDMSERRFRQDYLPAYKAAVDAGCKMVMTSFNTVDEVPATANRWLMHDVLREEWGFDGVTITDYAAILELMNHGVAQDMRDASALAMNATVDIDMKTSCYAHELEPLVKDGVIDEAAVDAACWRVLTLKNELGLFEDPFRGASVERAQEVIGTDDKYAEAIATARESLVLLKNEGNVLPLAKSGARVALIGPYADSKDIVGMWAIHADRSRSKTVRAAMEDVLGTDGFTYAKGCDMLDDEGMAQLGEFAAFLPGSDEVGKVPAEELEAEALAVCAGADVVVMCLGEHMLQSGEAGARTDITLPHQQRTLLRKVKELGKKVVVVLFNGRPLALADDLPYADAVLEAWYPGTAGGSAVSDVLFGDINPSGRLNMSFPVNAGQTPLYYAQFATGRPVGKNHTGRFVTGYLDAPIDGLFPFGFGLGYHSAELSQVTLSSDALHAGEKIVASVDVTNTGAVAGAEVVQLYLRDLVGFVVRPVKELKGFERVELEPGQTRTVAFQIDEEMLRFWRYDMTFGSEPGRFEVMVGLNSKNVSSVTFELLGE